MAGAAVEVEGLKEFRRALKAADASYPRELSKLHREIARLVAPRAVAAASVSSGSTRHFAGAIRASGTASSARLTVAPAATAAFWGAKQRTGWNAGNQAANQKPWVGAAWDPGGAGGPYALNPAIRASLNDIDRLAGDGMEDLYRKAFPT